MKSSRLSGIVLIALMSTTVYAEMPAKKTTPAVQVQEKEEKPEQKQADETKPKLGAKEAAASLAGLLFFAGLFLILVGVAAIDALSKKEKESEDAPEKTQKKSEEQEMKKTAVQQ